MLEDKSKMEIVAGIMAGRNGFLLAAGHKNTDDIQ